MGASVYSIDSLIRKTEHSIFLPFYHIVTDEPPLHIKNLYAPRSIEQFKADINFLLAHYQSISLQELIELYQSGKKSIKNYFHLTFDDGLKEFYTIVAPILKEKKVHATVFLNTDFIDNKDLFYRFKASILYEKLGDNNILAVSYNNKEELNRLAAKNNIDFKAYLQEENPYLTSNQIKELINDGFTFGAHSKNHPLYKALSFEEQIVQTKESVEIVSTQFNLSYKVFSFPFTDDGVSQKFFNKIRSDIDFTFGCAGLKEDTAKNHLQRVPMEGTAKSGKEIIKAEYFYCLIKQKIGKNKVVR